MKETIKSLVNKSQVDAALDTPVKNRAKIKKLETSDFSYLVDKSYFDLNGCQNCLVFQLFFKIFYNTYWQ